MRIIAGTLGGRHFDSPKSSRTHPMSDKMRGALFNTLGDIAGLSVLDAFAGSGALGFEALSRGARTVTLIERDNAAQLVIAHNLVSLGLENQAVLFRGSVTAWTKANPTQTFDLVVCDPPYDDVQPELLVKLIGHLKPHGTAVLSLPPPAKLVFTSDFQHLATKSYGDSTLNFYRRLK